MEHFNFSIITLHDGNQIIDTNHITQYDALTAPEMIVYIETDNDLTTLERMKRKAERLERTNRKHTLFNRFTSPRVAF